MKDVDIAIILTDLCSSHAKLMSDFLTEKIGPEEAREQMAALIQNYTKKITNRLEEHDRSN